MFPWSTIINQVLPADNWVRSPRSSRQQRKRVAGKFRWLNDDNMQPNQTCPDAVHICTRVAQIIGLKHQVLIFFSTGLVFVTLWYKQRRCQPHPAAVIQNQMNQFWRKECFHCIYTHVYLDIRTSNLDMRLPSMPVQLAFWHALRAVLQDSSDEGSIADVWSFFSRAVTRRNTWWHTSNGMYLHLQETRPSCKRTANDSHIRISKYLITGNHLNHP